jgi:GNAT superfamily N-acetyltransferase
MTITPALPSEADTLTEIAFAAKRHWKYPESWIAHWRTVLTITPEFVATHETFAAREGQRILGFAALVVQADELHLEHLWVLPAEMEHGVGRALFRHAQRRAQDLGFETFEVDSDPNSAGFYEHMGAERIGTIRTLIDGTLRELPVFRVHAQQSKSLP